MFRMTCITIAAVFMCAAAAIAAPPEDLRTRTSGSDWPSFLGPTGDSKSSERGLVVPWPKEGPRIVWQRRVGTGYGICAISRGRLFQFDRQGKRAVLDCLKSETGEPLWYFDYLTTYEDLFGYNNGPRCQPVVDEDRVYIFGAEGMLHCLNVADGKLLWKVDTADKFGVIQNFFGVGSTPVVFGDLLIVQIGGSPAESKSVAPLQLDRVVGNGSGVVAFDKRTGEVKYQLSDELASYASPKVATFNGESWCLMFARGGLLAFGAASGKQEFHFPWRASILESVNAANPVVVGDRVLISETYGPGTVLLKVKPGGCDVVWSDESRRRDKSMQAHWNTPVYHDGYVYGSSGRHTENAELRCIEFDTGKVMWSVPDLSRSSLLYVDGHFICLTEQGSLILFRATHEKFDPISTVVLSEPGTAPFGPSQLLKYPAWAAPILAHGLLYSRGDDRLVCLEVIPAAK